MYKQLINLRISPVKRVKKAYKSMYQEIQFNRSIKGK